MSAKSPYNIIITGSSGKTTTAHITSSALRQQGYSLKQLNVHSINDDTVEKLALLQKKEVDFLIILVPFQNLSSELLEFCRPQLVLVTNTWRNSEYIAGGNNTENDFFINLPGDCVVILNADCSRTLALSDITGGRVFNFSLFYGGAMAYTEALCVSWEKTSFLLRMTAELPVSAGVSFNVKSIFMQSGLLGKHNAGNLMAAALTVLTATGKDPAPDKELLSYNLPRHSQVINKSPLIIDDIMSTRQALESWLELAAFCPSSKTLLVYAPWEKETKKHLLATAAVLNRWYHLIPDFRLILCGSLQRKSVRQSLLASLKSNNLPFSLIPNPCDAIDEALIQSNKEDLILLGGGEIMNQAATISLRLQNRGHRYTALPPAANVVSLQNGFPNPT